MTPPIMSSAPSAPTDALDPFSFVHEGRTFTCCVEGSRNAARGRWWWFAVSTVAHERHAPFPAAAQDTHDSVQRRIVAYYDDLIARRSAPYQSRWQGRQGARPAAPAAAPAADVAAPPA